MADTYEKDLAQKSSLTTSDFIRVVGSDNVSYKQNMSSVMETMGLKYADLGSFSTQSALETALNNKLTAMPTNSTASLRIATSAPFGVFQSSGVTYICDLRKGGSATYASISLHGLGINAEIVGNKSSATWTFQKEPTRAEVDALASDSGWLTLVTGVKYRKVGKICYVNIEGYTATQTSGTETIGTLPTGYRPTGANIQWAARKGTNTLTAGWLTPGGVINYTAVSASGSLAGFICFPVV